MVARKKRVGKYQQDKRKYDKWVMEGRGQGIGELYIPWLHLMNNVWLCGSSQIMRNASHDEKI